jgi:hypothetical protein
MKKGVCKVKLFNFTLFLLSSDVAPVFTEVYALSPHPIGFEHVQKELSCLF